MMSTKHPLISIITPTWNREFFLQKLANSLMAQTVKNFEWIVGNDGSTDLTEEFIKSFAKKADFKIIYVSSSLRIEKLHRQYIIGACFWRVFQVVLTILYVLMQ